MTSRLTPFSLVFGERADERFSAVTEGLQRDGADPNDRDAFLMNREAVALVHELLPDGGLGDAVAHFAALIHHSYLHWRAGQWTFAIDRAIVDRLVRQDAVTQRGNLPPSYYLQFPRQLIWGRLNEGEPHQPLDGCFVSQATRRMRVLGVFGLHPDRQGFSVVESELLDGTRNDGGLPPAAFTPQMAGGSQAGLYSVTEPRELLALCRRASHYAALKYVEVSMESDRSIRVP